jgi:hypothetical protein
LRDGQLYFSELRCPPELLHDQDSGSPRDAANYDVQITPCYLRNGEYYKTDDRADYSGRDYLI